MAEKRRAAYKGDGTEFVYGVPARDLTESEYQALTTDERAAVRASPLYDVRSDREMQGPDRSDKTEAAPAPAGAAASE